MFFTFHELFGLAEPVTLDNRIASLSLALLYCETGRDADQRAEERRLEALGNDPAHTPRELYPTGDASYWNYDQVQQEAHYRQRLAAASAADNQHCTLLVFRTLVALEAASYGLQASDRYEAQLRALGETIDRGRELLGRDHPIFAEALHQQARALWQSANRFAFSTGPQRHRVVSNDALIMKEQAVVLDQSDPEGREGARRRAMDDRRRARLGEAAALLDQARAILREHPEGYEGLRARIDRDWEDLRREQAKMMPEAHVTGAVHLTHSERGDSDSL